MIQKGNAGLYHSLCLRMTVPNRPFRAFTTEMAQPKSMQKSAIEQCSRAPIYFRTRASHRSTGCDKIEDMNQTRLEAPQGLQSQTVAILGGSGFIGTRLARLLTERNVQVRIGDIRPSETFPDLWKQADVRSLESLREFVSGADTIVNLAAEHRDDVRPLSRYYETNVEGASQVCVWLRAMQAFVKSSSPAASPCMVSSRPRSMRMGFSLLSMLTAKPSWKQRLSFVAGPRKIHPAPWSSCGPRSCSAKATGETFTA